MKENAPEAGNSSALAEHSIADFTFDDLTALLRRAIRGTAALGAAAALVLWPAAGWPTAALFAVGAALSVASIFEWGRLFRMINARMEGRAGQGSGLGSGVVVALFLLRLAIFAAVIYGSLKCFQAAHSGSPLALLCGLALGLAGLAWEATRVLRR